MTTSNEPSIAPTAPPGPVRASFWILIASGALRVFVVIVVAVTWSTLTTQAMKTLHVTEATAHATLTAGIIQNLVFAAVYVLFAYLIRMGRNWARITLTVIIVVFGLYSILGATDALTLISVVVELAAVGLLYMTASKDYFAATKEATRQAKQAS